MRPLEQAYSFDCLVVDDQPASCQHLSRYIKRTSGIRLSSTVSDGIDAFDYLQTHPEINLIFLDIEMPSMSGFDLLKMIEQKNNGLLPLVILSTGHAEYAAKGYHFDRVVGFLHKVVSYQDFLSMVQKAKRTILRYSNEIISIPSESNSLNNQPQENFLLLQRERDMLLKALKIYRK